jgi:hypothetical protein
MLITFDNHGGSQTPQQSVAYEKPLPSVSVPQRDGYTFMGYYKDANGSGAKYYDSIGTGTRIWNIDGSATLHAHWQVNVYRVVLDKQNDTDADTISIAYDADMPTATAPTRSGYNFLGYWDAVGGGAQYYDAEMNGQTIWNKTANTTLYAHWQPLPDTLYLYKWDGEDGIDTIIPIYGLPMPSGLTPPLRTGYTFAGYWSAPNGGSIYYDANMQSDSLWNKCCDILYAGWTPDTFTLTLKCNYAGCRNRDIRVAYQQPVMLDADFLTRPGFWLTRCTFEPENPDGERFYNGARYNFTSDTSIYAMWDTAGYWVDFSLGYQTAEQSPMSQIFYFGRKIESLPKPVRYGYVLVGWYYPDTAGRRYDEDIVFDLYKNSTFVAKWVSDKPHTLTLVATPIGNINGNDTADITVYSGAPLKTAQHIPQAHCDTADFTGWFDEIYGGTQWTDQTNYPYDTDHCCLYARWSVSRPAPDTLPRLNIIVDSAKQNNPQNYRHWLVNNCDIDSVRVRFLELPQDLKVYYEGKNITNNFIVKTERPDIYHVRYEKRQNDLSGEDSLLIERRLNPKKIIMQKKHIMFVNNNTEDNGGYKFKEYQWLRNGVPIPGATGQYYYETDGNDIITPRSEDAYSVLLTTIAGKQIQTCYYPATANPVAQLSVYPNPARHDGYLTVVLPPDEPTQRVEVYSLSGLLVKAYDISGEPVQQILLDLPPGRYIVKVGSGTATVSVQ